LNLKNLRGFLPLVLCAASAVASAQVTFSNISASYQLNPGSVGGNWISSPNGAAGTIDFTGGAPAFKVGDSTSFSTGTSTISYDVTATNAIGSITWVLQGDVEDFGRVNYTFDVSNGSGSIGSSTGSVLGASYGGGANGAYTKVVTVNFTGSTAFHVTTTLASDVNGQNLPSTSIALVGTVENNLNPVPEPASIAGLCIGAAALLRRRRK
jgi:hypothetical protein